MLQQSPQLDRQAPVSMPFRSTSRCELGNQTTFDNSLVSGVNNTSSQAGRSSAPGTFVWQPAHINNKFMAMQKLFNLSQQYYNAQFQAHQISSGTAFWIQDMTPGSLEVFSQSEFFWTKIKSGIYFLKKNSDYLAWPELNEATRMISLRDTTPFFT
jgi:hypothetical protein